MIQYFPIVTGSLVVLGNVSVSGSINASGSVTISGSIASASYALSASNAATASSADNFLTRGTLTAQTIVVQTITSSIDYVTGSTRFGSLSSDTHDFTGSVRISGSLASTGSITTVAPTGNANLIIQTLQAAQNTQIQFVNTAKTVYIGNQIASAGSMFEVHDASLGASRLLISSSGNVGIGTTAPVYKLEVTSGSIASIGNEHAFYFRGVTGTPSDLYSFSADSATAYLYNHTSASILMTWSELGNVGIGTSLALSKLDVNLLASGARRLFVNYDDSLVTIKSANNSSTAESLRIWGDNIYFYTGSAGSELMRLTNTGRVGIGITNPSRKFQVMEAGTATSGDVIGVRNDNSTAGAYINFIAGGANAPAIGAKGNDITFTTDGYSGTEIMRLTSTSRVGIGTTTPSGSRLHVFIGNDGGSGTPGVILATSNGVNDIVRFQDGVTTVAVVKNDGRFGMGTTNTSTEANLHLGANGASEGGQLILQKATSYASASHLDNYQNYFRVMSGTDTTSSTVRLQVDMTTGLLDLPFGQIKFPASQNASSDPNTLDDYEEGTWTPAYADSGTTPSYTTQFGRYTKIGRLVHVVGKIHASNLSGGNTIRITGLPFSGAETTDAQQRCSARPEGDWSGFGSLFSTTVFRINGADFIGVRDSGGGSVFAVYSAYSGTLYFNFNVTYYT